MNAQTVAWIRVFISSAINGIIGAGGIVLNGLSNTGTVPRGTLMLAFITGGMLMLKDIQASLSHPPGA